MSGIRLKTCLFLALASLSAAQHVFISPATRFLVHPAGQPLSLTCKVVLDNKESFKVKAITWFDPKGYSITAGSGRVHIDTRGEQVELVLQVALPSDVGIYKCRVDLLSETESEKKHIEEVTTTLFIMGGYEVPHGEYRGNYQRQNDYINTTSLSNDTVEMTTATMPGNETTNNTGSRLYNLLLSDLLHFRNDTEGNTTTNCTTDGNVTSNCTTDGNTTINFTTDIKPRVLTNCTDDGNATTNCTTDGNSTTNCTSDSNNTTNCTTDDSTIIKFTTNIKPRALTNCTDDGNATTNCTTDGNSTTNCTSDGNNTTNCTTNGDVTAIVAEPSGCEKLDGQWSAERREGSLVLYTRVEGEGDIGGMWSPGPHQPWHQVEGSVDVNSGVFYMMAAPTSTNYIVSFTGTCSRCAGKARLDIIEVKMERKGESEQCQTAGVPVTKQHVYYKHT